MVMSFFVYFGLFFSEYLLGNRINTKKYFLSNDNKIKIKKQVLHISKNGLYVFLICLIMSLIPAIIAGIRYNVGGDYWNYYRIYNDYSTASINFSSIINIFSSELGFFILVKIINFIGGNYQLLLFASSFIIYWFMIHGIIRINNKNVGLMSLIYFCTLFGPSFNIIKQMIAGALIFWGFKYIFEKQFLKYLFIVSIASTFHTSAIFFITLYFLDVKELHGKNIIIILAVLIFVIIVPVYFQSIFNNLTSLNMFSEYKDSYSSLFIQSGTIKTLLLRLPILIPILFNIKKLIKDNQHSIFYLLLLSMEYSTLILSFSMHWAFRISYYFYVVEIPLASNVMRISTKNKKNIWGIFYILYYMFYFYYVFFVSGNDGLFPYMTI